MKRTDKGIRQSNIELLRIISILGVIILHYNNIYFGGGFQFAQGINRYVLYYLESLSIGGVNLYVLISGYYLCQNNKRILAKPIKLILQVMSFNIILYMIQIALHMYSFTKQGLFLNLLPNNYFAILYCTLYLFSTFLNYMFQKSVENGKENQLLVTGLILFSVSPIMLDVMQEVLGRDFGGLSSIGIAGSQNGYSIINFMLMYIIGAWIHKKEEKILPVLSKGKCLMGILGVAFLIVLWRMITEKMSTAPKTAWSYCNPAVILIAVLFFCLFKQLKIKNSQIINRFSKATFTVFLVHTFVLVHYCNISNQVQGSLVKMILSLIGTIICAYIVGVVADIVYTVSVGYVINVIMTKIPILNRDIYSE